MKVPAMVFRKEADGAGVADVLTAVAADARGEEIALRQGAGRADQHGEPEFSGRVVAGARVEAVE